MELTADQDRAVKAIKSRHRGWICRVDNGYGDDQVCVSVRSAAEVDEEGRPPFAVEYYVSSTGGIDDDLSGDYYASAEDFTDALPVLSLTPTSEMSEDTSWEQMADDERRDGDHYAQQETR